MTRLEQKQKTREQLFASAMDLFASRGFEAVSIEDIVKASGVARGTFYFHFPTKDDVLLEAIRRGEELILARVGALPEATPVHRLFSVTVAGFGEAWGHRRDLLPYAGAVSLRRIAGVREERDTDPLRKEIGRRVELAQARGELASPLPGGMLADIFLLDVFAALMSWSQSGEPPLEVLGQGVVDLFFYGVEGLATASAPGPRKATPKKHEKRSSKR
jgi:AcrR family transcriptional regulator